MELFTEPMLLKPGNLRAVEPVPHGGGGAGGGGGGVVEGEGGTLNSELATRLGLVAAVGVEQVATTATPCHRATVRDYRRAQSCWRVA